MGIKPTTSLLQCVCSTTWATTTAPHEIFYHMQHLRIRAKFVQGVNRLKNEHWYWHAVTGEKLFCQKEWTWNLKKTISRRRKLFKAEKFKNWSWTKLGDRKYKNEHPLSFPICQKKHFDKIFSKEMINFTFLIAVKMHRRLSCSGRLGPPACTRRRIISLLPLLLPTKMVLFAKISASLLLSFYVSWSIKNWGWGTSRDRLLKTSSIHSPYCSVRVSTGTP